MRYAIGIDLGTTNCVMACVDLDRETGPYPEIQTIELLQLLDENQVGTSKRLPSFLYYPTSAQMELVGEFSFRPNQWVIGEAAQQYGRRTSGRLISSAKSWLCHGRIDQEKGVLPWGGAEDITLMSPCEATENILKHLKFSWENSPQGREHDIKDQKVVVTLPASFDQQARQLTIQACQNAGLEHATLLEEPQAAFYHWIAARKGRWKEDMQGVNSVLICDIGGGTTDFSLVECQIDDESFSLSRDAVGRHLLLGGDNIDLAIAHLAEREISNNKKSLTTGQWQLLSQLTRHAKEQLLLPDSDEEIKIRLPGSGTKVIGSLRQALIKKSEIQDIVLDGFFPELNYQSYDPRKSSAGLSDMGLPYESEPAMTWHLMDFLNTHGKLNDDFPEAIMFNGGTLEPQIIRERIVEVLSPKCPGQINRDPQ